MKSHNTHIYALGNPKYKLRRPLLVTIEEYDDEMIAEIAELGLYLYASATSSALALSGLKAEIISSYERLVELGSEKLGPQMLQALEAMRAVIVVASGVR